MAMCWLVCKIHPQVGPRGVFFALLSLGTSSPKSPPGFRHRQAKLNMKKSFEPNAVKPPKEANTINKQN
jgi:hypothetical protein